jgi:Bacterial-like globin
MTATVNGTNSGESQPKKSGGKAALIDRLGGRPAVEAAVDIFYQKVTTDDRIKHYFENTDMRKLRAHQVCYHQKNPVHELVHVHA